MLSSFFSSPHLPVSSPSIHSHFNFSRFLSFNIYHFLSHHYLASFTLCQQVSLSFYFPCACLSWQDLPFPQLPQPPHPLSLFLSLSHQLTFKLSFWHMVPSHDPHSRLTHNAYRVLPWGVHCISSPTYPPYTIFFFRKCYYIASCYIIWSLSGGTEWVYCCKFGVTLSTPRPLSHQFTSPVSSLGDNSPRDALPCHPIWISAYCY